MDSEFIDVFNRLQAEYGRFSIFTGIWVRRYVENRAIASGIWTEGHSCSSFERLKSSFHEIEEQKKKIDQMILDARPFQVLGEVKGREETERKALINVFYFKAQSEMHVLQNLFSCLLLKNQSDGKIKPLA